MLNEKKTYLSPSNNTHSSFFVK